MHINTQHLTSLKRFWNVEMKRDDNTSAVKRLEARRKVSRTDAGSLILHFDEESTFRVDEEDDLQFIAKEDDGPLNSHDSDENEFLFEESASSEKDE